MLHLNLFQVVNCINVFASANINYLFERIFSPENAKKLSLNLCYTSTCIKTVYTIHHQPGIMQHCRGGEELLQWISSLCCSRWSISWWEDALIAHVGETRAIVMFLKSLWYQQFSIKARAGKWEIRFWISSGPSVRQVLLMRWGWGLGQKPNYRHLTHEKVEAWMTRCTFPHLSFRMQKCFYYCEISRVTATSATEPEPTRVLEGLGGIQGRQPAIWMIC